ncbi:beta,beta-carotene 15,15'-dioxygenase isoform X3 [Patella vulgata]|uniref:beta,beta-carotene 15,15'-dioxygenase isoform X3 n=1 Tax=Patella vulgata TaxID=6465 RepID=UPI00217FCCA1|nr:beta,beta-carotene 15,15'-dioxygenase isoform X3 [Patella vulgata]
MERNMSQTEEFVPVWQQYNPESQLPDPVPLAVKGTIPSWVKGSLYRNGSGVFQIGDSKMKHLFDGMAVLLRFIIENGEVKFQSKILNSESWEACYKANRLVVNQFGTNALPDPCKSIFSRFFSLFTSESPTDNTSVNIIERGDQLWALTETQKMNRVDPQTLSKIDQADLGKYVTVHLSTAHPHLEKDGSIYNLATNFDPKAAYNIVQIPAKSDGDLDFENSKIVASAPSRWKWNISYNHSFGMSENYFVILEQPFVYSIGRLIFRKFTNSTIEDCLVSYPEEQSVFHIIRKDGKEINVKYVTDPFFVFHYVNCYEEDGQLVIDLVWYKDVDSVNKLYVESLQGNAILQLGYAPLFARFVVPLDVTKAEVNKNLITLDTKATAVLQNDGSIFCTPDLYNKDSDGIIMELPQINYKTYNGKKYRYIYASPILTKKNRILKVDLKTRKFIECTDIDVNHLPGEPIFLPKPGSTREDEGVLLTPIIANKPGTESYLLILDAETMTELARATLPAKEIMTLTFHGFFKPM